MIFDRLRRPRGLEVSVVSHLWCLATLYDSCFGCRRSWVRFPAWPIQKFCLRRCVRDDSPRSLLRVQGIPGSNPGVARFFFCVWEFLAYADFMGINSTRQIKDRRRIQRQTQSQSQSSEALFASQILMRLSALSDYFIHFCYIFPLTRL